MSGIAAKPRNKLWTTPLRDLLRGRITGRVDWKSRIDQAGLPEPITKIILQVVHRTRLWRLEKSTVAEELIAHFADGLATGAVTADLIADFGDQRVAAKLIRRAKRRGRPMVWQAWNFLIQGFAILVAIYSVILARFCIGHPSPTVDYIARINSPILSRPAGDRAWPVWREAILAAADRRNRLCYAPDLPQFVKLFDRDHRATLQEKSAWVTKHLDALNLARVASKKLTMGFVLGSNGSIVDPTIFPTSQPFSASGLNQPLISVLLPHLNILREIAKMLSIDAEVNAVNKKGDLVESDLIAMLDMNRQLREPDSILITQLVALSIDGLANEAIQQALFHHPQALSDQQLVDLAHRLAGPRVAGDLLDFSGERYLFEDIVQRVYTDDGHGNGRLTLKGVKLLPMYTAVNGPTSSHPGDLLAMEATLPMVTASRADLMSRYNQLMDESQANFQLPLRLARWEPIDAEMVKVQNPITNIRYILLSIFLPSLDRIQQVGERYLGDRDGTLVAIALELYHRSHGDYPTALGQLSPLFLPEIPADRITGDPLRYKLMGGKPVVYSVGADRIDDGGTPPKPINGVTNRYSVADWNVAPAKATRGDWILYPPEDE